MNPRARQVGSTYVGACSNVNYYLAIYLCSIISFFLAGGTGSGVGTYITQSLRDEFPHAFMLNQVVWPYHAGEVIVQNYNAALTLAQLWQCADGLLVTDNDSIHKICSQLLRIDKVSFEDLNQLLGHKLASVLQPVCSGAEGSSHLIRNQLGG